MDVFRQNLAFIMSKSEFTAGIRFANDCTGNCYLFTNQLYKKCLEMGVKFEFNTQIEDIQIEKERISFNKDKSRWNLILIVM